MSDAIDINDVIFDADIYPRTAPSEQTVERYVDAIEAGSTFPPLILESGTNRLLDGRHRQLAHEAAGDDSVAAEWHTVPEGVPAKLYAAGLSSQHGDRIDTGDRRDLAREMYREQQDMKMVSGYLQVSLGTLHKDVADLFQADRTRRVAVAVLLRFAGWTQQAIADELGVDSKQTVSNFFTAEKTGQLSESDLRDAAQRLPEGVDINIGDAIEDTLYADEEADAFDELQRYADDGNTNAAEVLAEQQHRNHRERRAAFRLRDEQARKTAAEAEREHRQRQREHVDLIKRESGRIQSFLSGYDAAYSMRDHNHRDEILKALTDTQRKRFIKIEKETTWPSTRP